MPDTTYIHKVPFKSKNFFQPDNDIFDADLSPAAFMVYCYLLSLPPTWEIRLNHIHQKFKNQIKSKDYMIDLFRELQAKYYLVKVGDRKATKWHFFEKPDDGEKFMVDVADQKPNDFMVDETDQKDPVMVDEIDHKQKDTLLYNKNVFINKQGNASQKQKNPQQMNVPLMTAKVGGPPGKLPPGYEEKMKEIFPDRKVAHASR